MRPMWTAEVRGMLLTICRARNMILAIDSKEIIDLLVMIIGTGHIGNSPLRKEYNQKMHRIFT